MGSIAHGRLQALVAAWLVSHEQEWSIQVLIGPQVRVAHDELCTPDLCLLDAVATADKHVLDTPPLLCIEILEPGEWMSSMRKVLESYRAMGVAQSWLIDPVRWSAFVNDAAGLRVLDSTERLELPGTPIYLPLDELFARLD